MRNNIADLVNIFFDDFGRILKTGDYDFVESLKFIARQRNLQSINGFISTCRQMAQAMPMALSIDNYLDAHQQDSDVVMCGKLAIAKAILNAERNSTLWHDYRNEQGAGLAALQGTWIAKLVNVLTEGVSKDDIDTLFDNLTIISFNYDRCIKVFLREAVKIYYGLSDPDVDGVMKNLKIFHPYGSVGFLPFEDRSGINFGSERGGESLIEVSKGIKTFTEQFDDNDLLNEIRLRVRNSLNLIFLGFAFHRQNIELIAPDGPRSGERGFATAIGISPSDRAVIEDDLADKLFSSTFRMNFAANHQSSADLFDHYWRSITA